VVIRFNCNSLPQSGSIFFLIRYRDEKNDFMLEGSNLCQQYSYKFCTKCKPHWLKF
jgi:hypothetical protein